MKQAIKVGEKFLGHEVLVIADVQNIWQGSNYLIILKEQFSTMQAIIFDSYTISTAIRLDPQCSLATSTSF
jgi:hypothetical protein